MWLATVIEYQSHLPVRYNHNKKHYLFTRPRTTKKKKKFIRREHQLKLYIAVVSLEVSHFMRIEPQQPLPRLFDPPVEKLQVAATAVEFKNGTGQS
jgi:hypothetical protein